MAPTIEQLLDPHSHAAGFGPSFAGFGPSFAGMNLPAGAFAGAHYPSHAGMMLPPGAFAGFNFPHIGVPAMMHPAAMPHPAAPPAANFQQLMQTAALQHAAAAAAAQQPVVVPESATKKRRWPMGFASNGTIAVGSSQQLSSTPLAPAKAERLSTTDTGFLITSILSGMNNQSLTSTGILSDTCSPNAVDAYVNFDVTGPGYPVTMNVQNTTRNNSALNFNCTLWCAAIN